MTFADITIVPVLSDRKAVYLAFSRRMAEIYREHGATRIVDYWQAGPSASPDDFHAEGVSYSPGELQGLASVAGASHRESVVVTITEWPSKASAIEAPQRPHKTLASSPRSRRTPYSTGAAWSPRASKSR
ncbi:DUF1428 family protein [Streptomyces microflavus]|uniref:DUF1428 family protein n=1 Tax=Streptomyces microflavus TaxID=1919 RepID=UPI003424B7AF